MSNEFHNESIETCFHCLLKIVHENKHRVKFVHVYMHFMTSVLQETCNNINDEIVQNFKDTNFMDLITEIIVKIIGLMSKLEKEPIQYYMCQNAIQYLNIVKLDLKNQKRLVDTNSDNPGNLFYKHCPDIFDKICLYCDTTKYIDMTIPTAQIIHDIGFCILSNVFCTSIADLNMPEFFSHLKILIAVFIFLNPVENLPVVDVSVIESGNTMMKIINVILNQNPNITIQPYIVNIFGTKIELTSQHIVQICSLQRDVFFYYQHNNITSENHVAMMKFYLNKSIQELNKVLELGQPKSKTDRNIMFAFFFIYSTIREMIT